MRNKQITKYPSVVDSCKQDTVTLYYSIVLYLDLKKYVLFLLKPKYWLLLEGRSYISTLARSKYVNRRGEI